MSVYVPFESVQFASPARSQERRLLFRLLRWYDVLAALIYASIMLGVVWPVARHVPLYLLWPILAFAYAAVLMPVPLFNSSSAFMRWLRFARNPTNESPFDRLVSRAIAAILLRVEAARRSDVVRDATRLLGKHREARLRAQAIFFLIVNVIFMVTIRQAHLRYHLPLDDESVWLLYIQPIQLMARSGSIYWLGFICLVTALSGSLVHFVFGLPLLFDTVRVLAIKALWLALICLLPMLLVMYLSDRREGLATIRRLLPLIAEVRIPLDKGFANRVAEIISETLGYPYVNILLATSPGDPRGEGLRLIGASNPEGQALLETPFFLKRGEGITNWAASRKSACLVNDVNNDPRHRYFEHPAFPNTRSELALPIMHGDTLLGVLDLQSFHTYAFSRDDVELFEALTTHLALALDSAQNLALMRGLYMVARGASRGFVEYQTAEAALQAIVKVAWSVLQADSAVLYWRDTENAFLYGPIFDGNITYYPCPADIARMDPDSILPSAMQATDVTVKDYRRTNKSGLPSAKTNARPGTFVEREGIQTSIRIPLRGSDRGSQEAMGILFINYRKYRTISDETLDWCRALADLTVLTLQNVDVFQRVVMAERTVVRTEVHDGMAQSVSFARMLLEQVIAAHARSLNAPTGEIERVKLACELSQRLQQDVNYILGVWHSEPKGSLFTNLKHYADIVSKTLGLHCEFFSDDAGDESISPALSHQVERIVQEATHNAHRHGKATAIRIAARMSMNYLFVRVSDDGLGFDPKTVQPHGGLYTMANRVERLGGRFSIRRDPLAPGIVVRARIPLTLPEIQAPKFKLVPLDAPASAYAGEARRDDTAIASTPLRLPPKVLARVATRTRPRR